MIHSKRQVSHINLGLGVISKLLSRLDNPHLKIPPTIHIAGTNGKGSTLSFLRNIFEEARLKVHAYTSPHLVKFNERIILAGQEISDEFLEEVLQECEKAANQKPKINPTFFELTTAAAFLAFSKVKADILILETGLGGRLDATNILPKVLCSVITPIDFDHQEFLGNSLEKIAFEKAGIIKKNCPVIVSKQKEEVLEVLKNRASELNCKIIIFDRDFFIDENLVGDLGLVGSHQKINATVAVETINVMRSLSKHAGEAPKPGSCFDRLSMTSLKLILQKTTWPARLQKITSGRFFKKLGKNFELYLDGSHNLQGANTVLEFLESQKNKKIFVIFGMLQGKNCDGFLKIIAKKIDQLIAIEIPHESKSNPAETVKKIAEENEIKVVTAKDFDSAFEKIKCGEPSLILVCGSLYLAGSFLRENENSLE